MVKYIEKSGDRTELDAKDLTTRYSVDNVVSYALGLDAKCFEDDNSEFKKLAYDLFGGSFLQLLLISLSLIFPVLVNYLKIRCRYLDKFLIMLLHNVFPDLLEKLRKNNSELLSPVASNIASKTILYEMTC